MTSDWTLTRNPEQSSHFDVVWTEFLRQSNSGNVLVKSPYERSNHLHVDHYSLREVLGLKNAQSSLSDILPHVDPFLVVLKPGRDGEVISNDYLDEVPGEEDVPALLEFEDVHPYKEELSTTESSEPSSSQSRRASSDPGSNDDVRGDKNDLISDRL